MAIISFAVSVYGMQVNKSATFYMAPTRAWELLAGSIIALNVILFWFSVNWRIQSFELVYKNGEIHHAQTT